MLTDVEHKSVSPVFVGRATELDTLRRALTEVRTGEPRALLIGGGDVGKTRLLEEFTAEATGDGALVTLGACVESGTEGLPFAPFAAVLRTLRRLLPEEFAMRRRRAGGRTRPAPARPRRSRPRPLR